ncbi:MAG: hypothetical protein KGO50_01550 [Myxococcales bacterium]|nr:hypothetical protein [Myxococcales bacterium]
MTSRTNPPGNAGATPAARPVHQVAKDFDMTYRQFAERVAELGFSWDVSSLHKSLTSEQVAEFRQALRGGAPTLRIKTHTNSEIAPDGSKPLYQIAHENGLTLNQLRSFIREQRLGWDTASHMQPFTAAQISQLVDLGMRQRSNRPPGRFAANNESLSPSDVKQHTGTAPSVQSRTGESTAPTTTQVSMSDNTPKRKPGRPPKAASATPAPAAATTEKRKPGRPPKAASATPAPAAATTEKRKPGRPPKAASATPAPAAATTEKRKPGRPPKAASATPAPAAATAEKRKPGRPPKAAKATPAPAAATTEKRKPGRPPKAAKATPAPAAATTEKRKPGRPPKAASATPAPAAATTEKRKPGRPPKAAKAVTPAAPVAAPATVSPVAAADEVTSSERSWRVWEIANALGYNSKELSARFAEWGLSIDASSHMKFVTLAQVEALNARLAALKLNKRVNTANESSQRLYEVAESFNMSVPDLRKRIEDLKLGWDVSTHMKRLTSTQVATLGQKLAATKVTTASAIPAEPTVRLHELATRAGLKWPAFRAAAAAAGAKGDFGSHLRQITTAEAEALLKPVKAAPAQAAEPAPVSSVENKPALRRVHEAAATLGMKSPEFIARAKAAGVELGSHLAFVTPAQEAAIAAALSGTPVIAPAESAAAAPSEKRKPGRPAKAAPVAEVPAAAVEVPATVEKPAPPAPARTAPAAAPAPNPAFAAGSEYLGSVLPDLGVTRPKIAVSQSGDYVEFEISGFDAAKLLGSANAAARTDVVESLEQMTGKAIQNATGQTLLVRIDISGFRKNRRSEISEAAQRLARLVVDSNLPVAFGVIGSFDRFAFHNALKQDGVFTESEGQGAQRRLTVSPRRRKDA